MTRTQITLTSGGSVIVKGDIDYIGGRIMGHRGGFIFLTLATRVGHSSPPIYEERSVLVNIEQVVCAREVKE